jgi:hypothetical protein
MNHLDNQRILGDLARQMKHGEPLSKEQLDYLEKALERVSNGEDANVVLGVRATRGKSEKDAAARSKHSLILHWMACAIDSGGLTIEQACVEAMQHIVPAAHQLFGNPDNSIYDAEYLKKLWYRNPEMQNLDRDVFDHAFPYDPI